MVCPDAATGTRAPQLAQNLSLSPTLAPQFEQNGILNLLALFGHHYSTEKNGSEHFSLV